jgi:tetratricopeptide (TPR) repeat protein
MQILEIPALHPHRKGYQIVFEKAELSPELQKLTPKELKIFQELYLKIPEDPQKNIQALKQLHERSPHVPEIANLLTFAYLRLNKKKEAEALIEKTWAENPEHLTARINYADQALRLGKIELIPEIFQGCLDLNALYPNREHFHFAEFRGFMTVMGFYYLDKREKEKAEECYELAFQVDPLHPSVAALEKKLSKLSLLKKCIKTLQKLARISQKP